MWFSCGKEYSQEFVGRVLVPLGEEDAVLKVSFTRVTRHEPRPYGEGDSYEIIDEIEKEEYELDGQPIEHSALVSLFGSDADVFIDRAILSAH